MKTDDNGSAKFDMYFEVVTWRAIKKFSNMPKDDIEKGMNERRDFIQQCFNDDLTANEVVFQLTI